MKTKTIIAIFVLAILALSSIAIIPIKPVEAPGGTLTLSDAELMLPEFTWIFDPGSSLTGKTNVPGPGVKFDLAGLGKAGIGDNFPVNALAGGTGTSNGDFTAYNKYSMLFVNLGLNAIDVSLYMNTGWTNVNAWKDTFWCSNWVHLDANKSAIVTLDFSSSYEAWNIADDLEFPGHTNGEHGTPIWRLTEVSNIGFQVLGSGTASVLVSGTLTKLYLDPSVVNKTPNDVCTPFDVAVTLENFVNLAGFDIKLTWNSALITKTNVDYTTYLNALWGVGKWQIVLEQSGAGYYELAVAALATSATNAGASVLFKITFHVDRGCNFPLSTPIHFSMIKLSDNAQPVPNPIYAEVTDGMYYMSATKPDLEFKVKKRDKKTGLWAYVDPPYEFEFCDWIEVEVWVTHICVCSCLTDYYLKIEYDPNLISFTDVDYWGIFGIGTVSDSPGLIQVSGEGNPWSGDEGLLFALTFHVEFACTPEHIWKYGNPNFMTFPIGIVDAELSFGSNTVTLSDAELMLAEFAKEWGPGNLAGKIDVSGPGVQFDFTGLAGADTGVGDNFPVNALVGGAYKDYGSGFAGPYDFSGYKRYCVCICNVGTTPVTVALFMNTGWTNSPWGTPERDTFWQSDWVTIGSGECKAVCLDFSDATCYNADDDPIPEWQYPDGTSGVTVRRLDEVSNIGFEVLGNGAGSIVVKGCSVGIIGMDGIIIPPPLTIQINFIRGDVDCDGDVDTFDISSAAYYYGKTAPPEYDLTNNGVIDIYDMVAIATNFGYGL